MQEEKRNNTPTYTRTSSATHHNTEAQHKGVDEVLFDMHSSAQLSSFQLIWFWWQSGDEEPDCLGEEAVTECGRSDRDSTVPSARWLGDDKDGCSQPQCQWLCRYSIHGEDL